MAYNNGDQEVFELDVLRALQTHEIFFCVDDASNILSRNFAFRIGEVMASINPDKVNQEVNESAFYNRFRNVIFLVYTANEFLQLKSLPMILQKVAKIKLIAPSIEA